MQQHPHSQLGDWQLDDPPLGEGGMGVVYRARHRDDGRVVALKTVRVAGSGDTDKNLDRQVLEREVRALMRLDHPGVARVIDYDAHAEPPWVAMEYVEAPSLRSVLADRRTHVHPDTAATLNTAATASAIVSASWSTGQQTAAQGVAERVAPAPAAGASWGARVGLCVSLCEALDHVHDQGLVHRDLKPDNVLVRPDGRAVLVDFGLARAQRLDREALATSARVAGTLPYMAPERFAGIDDDPRSDLYALGCMLYEMVTGQRPFSGQGRALVEAHRAGLRQGPRALVRSIPEALDALIIELLARRPDARPARARRVAARLLELCPDAPRHPAPVAGPVHLLRPRLAGRHRVREALERDLLERAGDGARVVLVRGGAGVGKTRLAMVTMHRAGAAGVRVVAGSCRASDELGGGGPLSALREALGQLLEGQTLPASILAPLAQLVAGHDAPQQTSQDTSPATRRRQLLEAASAVLRTAAEAAPLLLVVDDVQWADALTLSLLERAADGQLGELRALALVRSDVDASQAALTELATRAGVSCRELDALGATAVGQMVGSMLGWSSPPEALCRALAQAAEGNPLFVAELTRAAVEEGQLVCAPDGSWSASSAAAERLIAALPPTLARLVARRTERLSEAARTLAARVAILGRTVETTLLEGWPAAGAPLDVTGALDELVARAVLEWVDAGQVRFVHHQLREHVLARLAVADRRALHLQAAEQLAAGDDADRWLSERAWHLDHGGALEAARALHRRAGKAAFDHDSRIAQAHYERAIALGAPTDLDTLRDRYKLTAVLSAMGQLDEALEHAESIAQAVTEAEPSAQTAELAVRADLARGEALNFLGRQRESWQLLVAQLERVRAMDDEVLLGDLLYLLALVGRKIGERERVVALLGEAIALHERRDESRRLARAKGVLGRVLSSGPEHARGVALLREAIAIDEGLGRLRDQAVDWLWLGHALFEASRIFDTVRALQRARELYEACGEPWHCIHTDADIALLRGYLGELDEAATALEGSIARIRRFPGWGSLSQLYTYLGQVELARGRFARCVEICELCFGSTASIDDVQAEGDLLAMKAQALHRLGRLDEAEAAICTGIERLSSLPRMHAEALAVRVMLLLHLGRDDEADAELARVRAILADHVDGIGRSLLACVEGHRALAAGRDASAHLRQARALLDASEYAPGSWPGQLVDRLARAQAAFAQGQPLIGGDAVAWLTPALRAALVERGRLVED